LRFFWFVWDFHLSIAPSRRGTTIWAKWGKICKISYRLLYFHPILLRFSNRLSKGKALVKII
jgi:hypothetical protein